MNEWKWMNGRICHSSVPLRRYAMAAEWGITYKLQLLVVRINILTIIYRFERHIIFSSRDNSLFRMNSDWQNGNCASYLKTLQLNSCEGECLTAASWVFQRWEALLTAASTIATYFVFWWWTPFALIFRTPRSKTVHSFNLWIQSHHHPPQTPVNFPKKRLSSYAIENFPKHPNYTHLLMGMPVPCNSQLPSLFNYTSDEQNRREQQCRLSNEAVQLFPGSQPVNKNHNAIIRSTEMYQ